MTREELIKRHCSDNDVIINAINYNGNPVSKALKVGTTFYYATSDIRNNKNYLIKCEIIEEKTHCQTCPFRNFVCSDIDCNAKVIKIYKE